MIDARQRAFPFRELMLLALAFACGGQVLGAGEAWKLREGVPNAVIFARQNRSGNQYHFCLGDSPVTPWQAFSREVAKVCEARVITPTFVVPEGADLARYTCVNGQAIFGERLYSGYLAVLDYSASGAKGDVAQTAFVLENLVRAIYGYRATHSIVMVHTTPSAYVAEAERIADHYGIPTLDLTDAKTPAERNERARQFAHALFAGPAPERIVPRKVLPAPLRKGTELRPFLISYEHEAIALGQGWLGWQRPRIQQVRHVLDAKKAGAELKVTFTGSEIGLYDEASAGSSTFTCRVDDGEPRTFAAPQGAVALRHTRLFGDLAPDREHVLTLTVNEAKEFRVVGFSVCGAVKSSASKLSPLERMRAHLKTLPSLDYTPPAGRFAPIPETMRRLREGKALTIVLLGDSIINDTSSSQFEQLLAQRYPACRITKRTSARGSTGCDWYAQENRVDEWVLRHKPDLLVIGGISHRPPDRVRDVVRQVRAKKPDTEFLILTPVFGAMSDSWNQSWTPEIDHSTPNWRATLERIAAEENCAFFDMTGPLGSFIEKSQMARGAFMRDVVHANDRGKAVLGELLNRWFAP